MDIKKNTLLTKIISFMRIEKDVLIFLILGLFICYIVPVVILLPQNLKDLYSIVGIACIFGIKAFLPALFIFILNKIIFIQKKEKIIKWLKIIKKVLYIIFTFYLIYWQIFIIAFFVVLFCEENWTLQ